MLITNKKFFKVINNSDNSDNGNKNEKLIK